MKKIYKTIEEIWVGLQWETLIYHSQSEIDLRKKSKITEKLNKNKYNKILNKIKI